MKTFNIPANLQTESEALEYVANNITLNGYESDYFDGELKFIEVLTGNEDFDYEAHEMTFSHLSEKVGPNNTREIYFN